MLPLVIGGRGRELRLFSKDSGLQPAGVGLSSHSFGMALRFHTTKLTGTPDMTRHGGRVMKTLLAIIILKPTCRRPLSSVTSPTSTDGLDLQPFGGSGQVA